MPSAFPKRIILSRKGWDSKAGGKPSPIFPDGTVVSLPIPDRHSGISYGDVRLSDRRSIGTMVESLTRGRISRNDEVHLDPDLSVHSIDRSRFTAAFGQCGPAQAHLENQAVTKESAARDGDLFLFFGLYRPVHNDMNEWQYTSTKAVHIIFGWLQVGEVLDLAKRQNTSGVGQSPPRDSLLHCSE